MLRPNPYTIGGAHSSESWDEDPIARVQHDRQHYDHDGFFTSGSGDGALMFCEPDSSRESITNPFTCPPEDSTTTPPSLMGPPLRKFSPSPVSGCGATKHRSGSELLPIAPPAIKKKTCAPGLRRDGAVEQFKWTSLLSESQRSPWVTKYIDRGKAYKDLQLDKENVMLQGAIDLKVEAGCAGGEAMTLRVKASPAVNVRLTTKRGVDCANLPHSNKENGGPAPKRICREKTGTDWQTVLDLVKYGQERDGDGKGSGSNGIRAEQPSVPLPSSSAFTTRVARNGENAVIEQVRAGALDA
ncbi:hypothetical protein C8R48DRAFT_677914 [Suillus tomentosus]|nr:hypothetical protein C8R48DRAFT_677914 [Suillus tomentosus]